MNIELMNIVLRQLTEFLHLEAHWNFVTTLSSLPFQILDGTASWK